MRVSTVAAIAGIGLLYGQLSFAATAQQSAGTAPKKQLAPSEQPSSTTSQAARLKTDKDKISYSIGIDLGQNFKSQGIDVNISLLEKGLEQGLTGQTPWLTQKQMADTLMTFQKKLIQKHQAEWAALSDKNKKEGEAFLEANKKKPGVITTPSGLQYKVISAGEGDHPTDKDSVTVNYTGKFINGKVFDSSYDRKQPATFPVTEVIPGWTEVIKLMKNNATFEVVIPSNLAYGTHGFGQTIGPNAVLIFDIHLVSLKKAS